MVGPSGVPHGGRPVDGGVTFIGFFAATTVETTYLERNPAPGTEGDAPQAAAVIDARNNS